MFVAHNAMYDLQFTGLKYWILTHPEYNNMERTDDLILDGKVWVRYLRKGKNYAELIFADSFQYLPASLDDLIKKYLKGEKFATKDEYKLSCNEWNEYIKENGEKLCLQDTIQLWKIFMKFLSFLSENQFSIVLAFSEITHPYFAIKYQIISAFHIVVFRMRQSFAIGYCFDGQTSFKFSTIDEFIEYAFALKSQSKCLHGR